MVTFISKSPEETLALGEQWGREARPGWLVGLTGDLGAGKTQLVKGIARGLGITERVHSPTFALVNEYRGGRRPLFHLDLYRLETRAQIVSAGLEEYVCALTGVVAVEWVERWFDSITDAQRACSAGISVRFVRIEAPAEAERRIVYEDTGA